MRKSLALFASLFALAVLPACDGGPPITPMVDAGFDAGPPTDAGTDAGVDPGPARAIFVLPREGDERGFFDLPWPNDVRRTAEGTIDLTAFPRPRNNALLARYLEAGTNTLDGYGLNGAIYFRFSRPIDVESLPSDGAESLEAGSALWLIDVDPESPERGRRYPVRWHWQAETTRFWARHTLAMRPVYGVPLASARRYAAVLTRDVVGSAGEALARDEDLESLLEGGGDATVDAARGIYEPVLETLEEAGLERDEILSLAVFTTQDAISELLTIRDWLVDAYPEPEIIDDTLVRERDTTFYTELRGQYGPNPIFQDGEIPYANEGGAIRLDAEGVPVVHGEADYRFALTIPREGMPEEGFPVVLYAHGTSGSYRSFISDETGVLLAREGYAVMGVDQIHHGERNPTTQDPAILYFNIPNPDAARDNGRQSALDIVQQARLIRNLHIPLEVLDHDDEPVRLDASRIYFVGHSQGGLNGPIYLGIDDSARAALLSAPSGIITNALIDKLEPLVIPDVVRLLLNLPGSGWEDAYAIESFVVEHPVATLLQTWIEASDTVNYAHLISRAPREGFAPKSVIMIEGLRDLYSPPASVEALAGAAGLPLLDPFDVSVESIELNGHGPVTAPFSGNLAEGQATGALIQLPEQGHFGFFRDQDLRRQIRGFFRSLSEDGLPGTFPTPPE